MAVQESSKIEAQQRYYAGSGRSSTNTKRKLSDSKESLEKRGKKLIDSHSEESVSSISSVGEEAEMANTSRSSMKMDTKELDTAMKKVMLDDELSDMLVRKFKAICDDRIDGQTSEMKEEMKNIKEKQDSHTARFEKVESKVNRLEQDKCLKNLLIRGINIGGRNLKQAFIITLNKELGAQLKTPDISYVIPIGKTEDMMLKVAFNDSKKREEVYSARSKLKGKYLWITEDLTP